MKILQLTQFYYPEDIFKGLSFSKELQKRGHDVEVLTGFPNYPSGKIFNGYKLKLFQREIINNIRINRTALYPSHDQSGIKRIFNYLSFGLSSFFIGPFLVKKPDIIYIYNLVTLAFTARLLKLIHGCKVVYDVQDLWPDSVFLSGLMKFPFLNNLLSRWCLWAYNSADQLVTLSPGMKDKLIERGVTKPIDVIYNWTHENPETEPSDKILKFDDDVEGVKRFNVLYAGAMGTFQNLDTVLDTAVICREKLPIVRFVLIGDGMERKQLADRIKCKNLTNVVLLPPRKPDQMEEVYNSADALIVHLKRYPLFKFTIPSKTQAYLSVGKPIIMAVEGDAADLVKRAGAGVVAEPESPEDLFRAIKEISKYPDEKLQKMSYSAKEFYQTTLSRSVGIDKFVDLFNRL